MEIKKFRKFNIPKNAFSFFYIFFFIIIFFSCIIILYVIPQGYALQISPILFIGFTFVIFGFFLFFLIDLKTEDKHFIKFRFFSEGFLKIIIVILMGISLFIPPIVYPFTVISWTEIQILNYIRGIVFVLGGAFLPGSSILNILFPGKMLSKKFRLESFLIKLTLSPLLSFLMIGTIVLILDSLGIIFKEIYMIVLFLFIILLIFLEFISQRLRNSKDTIFKRKIGLYHISKTTFIIILITIGVSVVSLGIHASTHYLITGDSWTALNPTIFIGDSVESTITQGKISRYPIFWCYVSYGLSVLNGLPFINTNAMMAPFCYLYVTSIYLLCKSILYNLKSRYAVLSTLIISMFSDLFLFFPSFNNNSIIESTVGSISVLIFSGQFFFYYKSFALYLVFTSIALFIFVFTKKRRKDTKNFNKKFDLKLLILAALLLTGSYMSYMIPLIPAMAFITIFFVFSKKRKKQNHYLLFFLSFLLLFFFLYDIGTNLFNSFLFSDKFSDFIVWMTASEDLNNLILNFLAYLFFSIIFIIYFASYFLNQLRKKHIYSNYFQKNKMPHNNSSNYRNRLKNALTNKKNQKKIILILLSCFILVIFLEIFNLFFKFYIFKFVFIEANYWLYSISIFLDIIFLSLGLFGIGGMLFSVLCFEKNRRIFAILVVWVLFSLFYASLVHLSQILSSYIFKTPPQNIETVFIKYMVFWFTRNWYYAIIPLSIFFAIGVIDLKKFIRKIKIRNFYFLIKLKPRTKTAIKFSALTTIIIFSYTNIIIASMNWGRTGGEGTVSDREAQIIGYLPTLIPENSLILTEHKYSLFHGIKTMTSHRYISAYYLFDPHLNYKSYIENIEKYNVDYAILFDYGHIGLAQVILSFINNFLTKYFYTNILYQFQGLKLYEYNPIEIEPYHQASQDFIIYAEGMNPGYLSNTWEDFSSLGSRIQVLNKKANHSKVLEMNSLSGYTAIRKGEPLISKGSVEFWVYITNASQRFSYKIYKYQNTMFEFMIDNNEWKYVNKTGDICVIPKLNSTPKDNTWHHIRIDFESSNQKYQALEQYKWCVIIDNFDISEEIDFIDPSEGKWAYHYFQTGISTNLTVYLDAIGFSWDNYYDLGSNMNKSAFYI